MKAVGFYFAAPGATFARFMVILERLTSQASRSLVAMTGHGQFVEGRDRHGPRGRLRRGALPSRIAKPAPSLSVSSLFLL